MKFRSHIKRPHFNSSATSTSYTPKQLASFYGVPANATGAGKNVAVIELGGGYVQSDLDAYFKSLGFTVAPVTFHSIDGGTNSPGDPNGADAEVMLDLCVIGGMAPGVKLHCYMAPNTDQGFLDAINQAVVDKMDAISISWGGAEDQWDAASLTSFNNAFQKAANAGIAVTVAAGDNGSSDGETGNHVDFPASSPFVTACGGTSLPSLSVAKEVVWNDGTAGGATGGGVSTHFAIPSYQSAVGVPGNKYRGVPDVAGNADPNSGWIIAVDGQSLVVGGTSAVAPMYAAIAAIVGQVTGKNVGLLNTAFYGLPSGCFRDIVSGNNGTYIAKAGWDCCTGLGVPVVNKIIAALTPAPTPVPPAPGPTGPTGPTGPAPTTITRTLVVSGAGLVLTVDGKAV
jgi:kumamolisin